MCRESRPFRDNWRPINQRRTRQGTTGQESRLFQFTIGWKWRGAIWWWVHFCGHEITFLVHMIWQITPFWLQGGPMQQESPNWKTQSRKFKPGCRKKTNKLMSSWTPPKEEGPPWTHFNAGLKNMDGSIGQWPSSLTMEWVSLSSLSSIPCIPPPFFLTCVNPRPGVAVNNLMDNIFANDKSM